MSWKTSPPGDYISNEHFDGDFFRVEIPIYPKEPYDVALLCQVRVYRNKKKQVFESWVTCPLKEAETAGYRYTDRMSNLHLLTFRIPGGYIITSGTETDIQFRLHFCDVAGRRLSDYTISEHRIGTATAKKPTPTDANSEKKVPIVTVQTKKYIEAKAKRYGKSKSTGKIWNELAELVK